MSPAPPSKSGRSRTPRGGRRRGGLGPFLTRLVVENFWLKLIALVVALGLYDVLHSARGAQRTIKVPIVADMPPPSVGRTLVTDIPETVSVTVEGPRQQVDNLDQAELDPIPLNLRAAHDGEVVLTPEMIAGLPSGVRVTRIIPQSLQIRWEDVIQLQLDVQVPITGQPAPGMELTNGVDVKPQKITATGPESRVKSIQLARAEPFDVSGLGPGKHTRSLPLDAPPPNVELSARTVEATVEVGRKLVTRELELKVQVVGLPRATVDPATVRVIVEGTPERIEALRPESVVARVEPRDEEVDTSTPGSAMMPVLIEIPDAKVTIEPAKVLVKW